MTESHDRLLPRRDWLILPLIALLSAVSAVGVCEIAARLIWRSHVYDSCSIPDRSLGVRYRPNCSALVKKPETPWVEDAYNACGLRTAESCGPKPPKGFRVAILGLSIASGFMVPYPQTYAAQTTALLSQRCHVPVDLQNLAVPGATLDTAILHLDQAMALHTDAVLMVLSAQDIEKLPEVAPHAHRATPPGMDPLSYAMEKSRAVAVAQHYLYQDPASYVSTYVQQGDEAAYLRAPLDPAWQRRVRSFEREMAAIAARTAAQAVPFKLVFVPTRAQSILAHEPGTHPALDAALLGRTLRQAARPLGVDMLDLTRAFGDRADAAELHYRVDMHPNGTGSLVVARALAPFLARDPKLAFCSQDGIAWR